MVKWARNNHNGGFIRLAFIPESRMFDGEAFKRLTFFTGCWEQGMGKCKGDECGSDLSFNAFSRKITVPNIIPDGDYVLAYLWFGGADKSRKKAQFGDYSSCSFVRIRGGAKLRRKRRIYPFFGVGKTRGRRNKPSCLSYTSRPGLCRMGCDNKAAFQRKPWPFNTRKKPAPLYAALYHADDRRRGICTKRVCCPLSCRLCEGNNCGRRKGGPRRCCPSKILKWAPKCRKGVKAPCVN